MALLVSQLTTIPDDSSGDLDSANGRAQLWWIAPDGTEIELTDRSAGYRLLRGATGFGVPGVEISADRHPRHGATVRGLSRPPRLVTLPVRISGTTPAEFGARYDALADAMGQTDWRGPGLLRIARQDGRRREIPAILQDGLDGTRGLGHTSETCVITLWCPDPYWLDLDPVQLTYSYAEGQAFWRPGGFVVVSSSLTLGDTLVHNSGGVEVWPVWKITGPCGLFTATHGALDASWVIDPSADGIGRPTILAGETVTVETWTETVTGPDGEDWAPGLNFPSADLFPILPGQNPVVFELAGAGAGSSVVLEFVPRHRSA